MQPSTEFAIQLTLSILILIGLAIYYSVDIKYYFKTKNQMAKLNKYTIYRGTGKNRRSKSYTSILDVYYNTGIIQSELGAKFAYKKEQLGENYKGTMHLQIIGKGKFAGIKMTVKKTELEVKENIPVIRNKKNCCISRDKILIECSYEEFYSIYKPKY